MTDVIAIGAAIGAFKNLADLVGKLGDGRSEESREAVAELYNSVLDIQQQLLAAQHREHDLLARYRALEEEIAHARDWQAEAARYVLRSVEGGVVRQQKADHASADPPHWLCANCFEEKMRSYLQRDARVVNGRNLWKCARCSSAVLVDPDTAPGIDSAKSLDESALT